MKKVKTYSETGHWYCTGCDSIQDDVRRFDTVLDGICVKQSWLCRLCQARILNTGAIGKLKEALVKSLEMYEKGLKNG